MVGVRIRDATNTLRTVARIRVRDATNTLRTIQRVRIRDAGNVLRTVWQFLQASSNRSIIAGVGNGTPSVDITTNNATISVVGGTAPFTYAWSEINDIDGRWTINSPTAAMTNVTCTAVEAGEFISLTIQCLVTDATGATDTVDVIAQVQNLALGP